jgi:hypothetical protein
VLNAPFAMAALDLISHVDLAYHATQTSEVLHSPVVFIDHNVHDHPLYLVCPDVLSLVGELLSGDGAVHRIKYSFIFFFTY